MVVKKMIESMMALGFSEYETRAYLSTLSLKTASAYEIAREAGIPSSKVYEVIARLEEKGLLLALGGSERKRYAALGRDEFLARERVAYQRHLDALEEGFSRMDAQEEVSFIWNFSDYDYLVEKSLRLIGEAERTILVSLWGEETAAIKTKLEAAEQRGVKTAVIHFGRADLNVGAVFPHPIEDTLYAERGGRGYTLVIDGRAALTGTVFTDGRVEGAWSTNRGFVLLAEDYVKHDIYIMKIVARFNEELVDRFGENYRLLRDIFQDKEMGS